VQLALDVEAEDRVDVAATDREDSHGAQRAGAGAPILQDEDARIVGEDRHQPAVQLGHRAGHDDEAARGSAHGLTEE
jgi:hypothetical protein